jgi:NAD(P)-dependent dehydrogenase (short-subunit alcohol dehydrogenase family)
MGEFDGGIAVVTGASGGMGLATAEAFAREGAHCVLVDVNRAAGEEAAQRIASAGGKASFEICDVRDAAAVQALFDRVRRDHKRLDFAFNNAGIDLETDLEPSWDIEAFDRTVATNLRGVFLCIRAEVKLMRESGGGAIVNTSSVLGLKTEANKPAYCASKFGVVGLTRSAARQFASEGIRVNVVCPGTIMTSMLQAALSAIPQGAELVAQSIPARRYGEPAEIADAVLWLCSKRASYVTGLALPVDGGLVA